MNLYVRIFLIVLIIVSVAFVGITDMMTNTIGDAAWGLSYVPFEIRGPIYMIIAFLLIAIVTALTDSN